VAAGNLAEMVPFRLRGWDLVVSDASDGALREVEQRGATVTRISADRCHVVLPADAPPDEAIARMTADGGRLVSLNPVRDTLEDFFVAQVAQQARP
jgi:hypothetical protein